MLERLATLFNYFNREDGIAFGKPTATEGKTFLIDLYSSFSLSYRLPDLVFKALK